MVYQSHSSIIQEAAMSQGDQLKKLFSPIYINKTEIRNRIAMPAMHLGYTPDGLVSERLNEFYLDRAKGGVGLIIIGGCTIDEYGGMAGMIAIHDDRFTEGFSRLAQAVQGEGAKLFAQLYQAGRYAFSFLIGGKTPLAPSAVRSKLTGETPKAMDLEEIAMVQQSFVQAALRCQQAGLDGVEVLGSAGYLISQFLSPITNKREDEYGGSWENRTRFGREVVEKIRQAVGPDFSIMVRIAGNDFMPGGNTNREAALFAQILEKAGADALNVTGGWHETRVPQLSMMLPQGAFTYLAQGVKKTVAIPVVACNRINDPVLADQVLLDGQADMIGMARALITDPLMPKKAMSGDFQSIQHCIACNQGCFDEVFKLQPVTCLVNPRAGKEKEYPIIRAEKKKKVLIAGGGPAGMMAAVTAARRGHRVALYERESSLGGQLPLAASPPGREEMATLVKDLAYQLETHSVEVHLDHEVTSALAEALAPEVIVVATGAKPLIPDMPGVQLNHVHLAWDVLDNRVPLDNPVAVIGGGAVGCETALLLARIGTIKPEVLYFLLENQAETMETLGDLILKGNKEIHLIEMLSKLGTDIGASSRWTILQDIHRRGIQTHLGSKVIEITSEGVVIQKDDSLKTIPARTVILATGVGPANQLYEELKGQVSEIYLIGDAQSPRKALEAVREGLEVGLKI
jgi:2,4-dienoyl-CoA reductase-like NADH-dependent reductase (Old Yellow Enzyme family)/thioredoxin reductase